MNAEACRPGRAFLLQWVLANAAGAVAGLSLFWWATQAGDARGSQPPGLKLLLAVGTETGLILALPAAVVGGLQWLVLRRWLGHAGWWTAATTAALAAGMWAFLAAFSLGASVLGEESAVSVPLGALAGGLTAGGVQWLVLRRQVPHAGRWVLLSGVAGPPCLIVFLAATQALDTTVAGVVRGGALTGTLYGALTGPVLAFLLSARTAAARNPQAPYVSQPAAAGSVRPLANPRS